ncbi:hypothetical protein ACFQL0_14630 [Haloplanus litoreus]|uniref:hypothetical protein n=1 Tax=Haloplanus litoreus TaxID=767515 RepID=UPI0036063B84
MDENLRRDGPRRGLTVLETGEGNYLVGGTKTPERGGDGSPWLLSVDGTGAVRWERTYGDREGPGLVASAVETDDGEFLVCGSTYVPDRDDSEGWLARVGPGGDVRWQRTFGDRGLWRLWSLATTGDGSFAVLGFNGDAATNPDAARLLGFDGAGAVEWDWSADSSAETGGFGLTATGGDYLLAGYRNESEGGNSDGWLVRLSPPTANATESPVGDDRPSDVDETPPAADTDDSERVEGEIDGDGNGGDGERDASTRRRRRSRCPRRRLPLVPEFGRRRWDGDSPDHAGRGTGDASESPVTGASTAPPDRNSGRDTRGTAPHPGPDSDAVTTGRMDAGRERDTNERTTADTSASHTDPAGDRSSATPSAEAATTEGRTDSSADEPTPAAAGDADDPTSVPVADLDPDDVSALLDRMEAGDGLERTADRLEAVAAERPELLDHTDAVDRLRDLRLDPDPAVSRAATEALDGVADDGR